MEKFLDNLDQKNIKLFKDLADTIYMHYRKGVRTTDEEYGREITKVHEIIFENISQSKKKLGKHFFLWKSLLKLIRSKTSKYIQATTIGIVPGFSADLLLEQYEDPSLTRVKRIAFAVSMLGPFYSICGIDETFVKLDGGSYHAINIVTVSPFMEFEHDFDLIRQSIAHVYPEYSFVPFEICMYRVKDTYSMDSIDEPGTIYSFLFNFSFRWYRHHFSRGEKFFGVPKNPNVKLTLMPPPPIKHDSN